MAFSLVFFVVEGWFGPTFLVQKHAAVVPLKGGVVRWSGVIFSGQESYKSTILTNQLMSYVAVCMPALGSAFALRASPCDATGTIPASGSYVCVCVLCVLCGDTCQIILRETRKAEANVDVNANSSNLGLRW